MIMEVLLYLICGAFAGILACAAFYQRRVAQANADNSRLKSDIVECRGRADAANIRVEEMRNGYEKQLAELRAAHAAQLADIDCRHGRQIAGLKEQHDTMIADISAQIGRAHV